VRYQARLTIVPAFDLRRRHRHRARDRGSGRTRSGLNAPSLTIRGATIEGDRRRCAGGGLHWVAAPRPIGRGRKLHVEFRCRVFAQARPRRSERREDRWYALKSSKRSRPARLSPLVAELQDALAALPSTRERGTSSLQHAELSVKRAGGDEDRRLAGRTSRARVTWSPSLWAPPSWSPGVTRGETGSPCGVRPRAVAAAKTVRSQRSRQRCGSLEKYFVAFPYDKPTLSHPAADEVRRVENAVVNFAPRLHGRAPRDESIHVSSAPTTRVAASSSRTNGSQTWYQPRGGTKSGSRVVRELAPRVKIVDAGTRLEPPHFLVVARATALEADADHPRDDTEPIASNDDSKTRSTASLPEG